jgi:DNA polymerase III alpha subunit (gram-positive type)
MKTQYDGYKLCFIDVETTGLDLKTHNIFQISARITDSRAKEVLDKIDLTFRPFTMEAEQEALDLHGWSLEKMAELQMSSEQAYREFVSWLERHVDRFNKQDKLHFVAYNAKFDADWVRSWFGKHNDFYYGSYFWNPPICVMIGAAWFTQRVRGAFGNFKLGTLCQAAELGWDEAGAHDAGYDIDKTIELYRYLNENLVSL